MRKVLILFAHPKFEKSVANRALKQAITQFDVSQPGQITFHDLYELYPDFNIDISIEKEQLLAHDIIIWHHPFYWYSCPPLLKQWIDMVLEFGWAYGPNGNALQDKLIFNTITTGGAGDAYREDGRNRFTLRQFLVPFEQTARLCKMKYLPPFAIQGTHRLIEDELHNFTGVYSRLLRFLMEQDRATILDLGDLQQLNEKFSFK